jgi:hypothetical protein
VRERDGRERAGCATSSALLAYSARRGGPVPARFAASSFLRKVRTDSLCVNQSYSRGKATLSVTGCLMTTRKRKERARANSRRSVPIFSIDCGDFSTKRRFVGSQNLPHVATAPSNVAADGAWPPAGHMLPALSNAATSRSLVWNLRIHWPSKFHSRHPF